MQALFERAIMLTPDISIISLCPERPLQYIAGQFVEIHIPHERMDARGNTRWFTLISTPDESSLQFVVRFPAAPSSFKRALTALRPGDSLQVNQPLGDFVLPKSTHVPLIWMAGGIGAASFVSMAKTLISDQTRRHITLFQSARIPDELLFPDLWHTAGISLQRTVTGDVGTWQGRRTRFSVAELLAADSLPGQAMFYISGSEIMVAELCNTLAQRGISNLQIVREAFTGY